MVKKLECGIILGFETKRVIMLSTICNKTYVENMKVVELIDNNTGKWKIDMLNLYFNQHVVNLILSMHIFKDISEDKCAWRFTSHGEYILERLLDNSDIKAFGNWMKIWNKKIPQKVKVFLRCAARGCLPTTE